MAESESSDEEWEGQEDEVEPYNSETECLFCDAILNSPEVLFDHCIQKHSFDIVSFNKKVTLDAIAYIKLVNYVRVNKLSADDIIDVTKEPFPWDSDDFMKPTLQNDPLLTFDIESFLEEKCSADNMDETVTILKRDYEALLQKLAHTNTQLQNAFDRIERMKETAKNMLYASGDNRAVETNHSSCCDNDSYYFSSYDHFGIHHEMLQDKVRTVAYQDAILGNREVFANKKVLDVGCGTAILSMFAASAGSSKVFAIDKSDVIYQAMDIVRENELDSVIDVYKGRVEDVNLPSKVDIIVSEWMGYFLLFEGMLDSVLYARDRYLSPGGLLLPDRCTLSLVAISDPEKHHQYVTFWDDVYGYKMSVLKREVVKEANIEDIKPDHLCSDSVVIKEFDLFTCSVEDTEFVSKFDLLMTKTCKVTSLVGYFDCMFEKGLNKKITLSTSPTSEATHWKQTTFVLPSPVEVKSGEQISCRLSCRKNRRDPRTLIVKIDFGSAYNQYFLS